MEMTEFTIEHVDEHHKKHVISSLKSDIIRHVFAFYDIQHDPKHTTMLAAFESGKLKGYLLTYTALEPTSVIMECENETAEILIEHAPADKFVMHAPPDLLPTIKERFPTAKHYLENWMLVKKGQANVFKSESTRRLRSEEDSEKLFRLLETRKERNPSSMKRYFDWMTRMPLYDLFVNGELVSYAGSFLQLPQLWMLGGVYTRPDHRGKGYATQVTSAVTEEALGNAEAAALFVRSDNYAAIKAYEKIGFRKIGEKLWVDVGTGLKP
jgi:RimJ/RimL family protein N-acetyltransferase